MTAVSDNFNRADGAIGAAWAETRAGDNFEIVSNLIQAEVGGPVARYGTSLGGADHYAEVYLATMPANMTGGPCARMDTSTGTCYIFAVRNAATSTYRIFKFDGADTTTAIATVSTTAPSFPCTAKITAEGTTIKGYVDGVEVISVVNTDNQTQTYGGIYANIVGGVFGTIDNFSAALLNEASITIGAPVAKFIDQRDANDECDITVSGTYAGTPTAIEARFDGGTWVTLDASPSAGTYSGTLTCSAGQGAIEVRFSNDTGTTASVADIGVGDVFLCTGQSNSAGHGDNNQSYTHASLMATMYNSDTSAWEELLDPTAIADTYGSMWPLLATLLMAEEGVPVAFIPMGVGSTNSSVWVPGALRYENAVTAVEDSGVTGVKAVIHYQGEADASSETAQATFLSRLVSMIEGFGSELPGAPPVVLFQLANNEFAGLDTIREALQILWARSDCYAGPVLYDIDLTAGDSLHLETDAQLGIGADRCFVALTGLYAGTGDVRTRALSAVKTSPTSITVSCNRTVAGESLSATPWHVTDQTGDNDVTAAAISGGTVVLTLDRALDGPATLDFVQLDEAGGLTVPMATIATIDVPLEPIYDMEVRTISPGGIRNVQRNRSLRI